MVFENIYSSSRNQLDRCALLVCFPDPTMKHASPYLVTFYIITVLMVLYFFCNITQSVVTVWYDTIRLSGSGEISEVVKG